jgi:hypothetical protein
MRRKEAKLIIIIIIFLIGKTHYLISYRSACLATIKSVYLCSGKEKKSVY